MVSRVGSQRFETVIEVAEAGLAQLVLRYANGWSDDRTGALLVDGAHVQDVVFPSTRAWDLTDRLEIPLELTAGGHSIAIDSFNRSGADIREAFVAGVDGSTGAGGGVLRGDLDDLALAAAGLLAASATEAHGGARTAAGGGASTQNSEVSAGDGEGGTARTGSRAPEGRSGDVEFAFGTPEGPGEGAASAETGSTHVGGRLADPIPHGTVPASGGAPETIHVEKSHANFATVAAPAESGGADEPVTDPEPGAPPTDNSSTGDDASVEQPSGSEPTEEVTSTDPGTSTDDQTDSSNDDISGNDAAMALPIIFQEDAFGLLGTDTVIRNPENKEPTSVTSPEEFDQYGLRPGYSGAGYLDLGGSAGDKFTLTVAAADVGPAGPYSLVVKFANGSADARGFAVVHDGAVVAQVDDTRTGDFGVWDTISIDIDLSQVDADGNYVLTFRQIGSQGPNFDAIALAPAGTSVSFLDPAFNGSETLTVMEGKTEIATVEASDADGQVLSYAVTGGADRDLFQVNPATGVLSFVDAPAYSGTADAYAVEVTVTDEAGATATRAYTVTVSERFDPIYVQAETGVLAGAGGASPVSQMMTQTNEADEGESAKDAFGLRPGYSGEGYLDFGSTGESASYAVSPTRADTYDLHIRYASSGPRNAEIRIDGSTVATLSFPDTTGADGSEPFDNWAVMTLPVTLAAGANEIELYLNNGNGPNVDVLAITAPGELPDFAPRFDAPGAFTIAEGETEVGAVAASDVVSDTTEGGTPGPVSYAITGGTDAELLAIDEQTGQLSLLAVANFEAKASYEVEVSAIDAGGNATAQAVTVTVTDLDEAPSVPVFTGIASFADDIAPGTVVGTVSAIDPEGAEIAFTLDDPRFAIVSGEIVVAEGVSFASGENVSLNVTASDGGLSSVAVLDFSVTEGEVEEPPAGATVALTFTDETLSGYAGSQDQGNDYAIADDGATLQLNDNHWKRAALGTDYTITANTRLTVDVTIGDDEPELVAIGFDGDESAFDGDRNLYLLDGTDGQGAFVNLKGSGTPLGDGVVRYVVDLSAHAGTTIGSLVFVADDDSASRGGLGSVSFGNVQLIEGGVEPGVNAAPDVVGGGIVDLSITEGAPLEIDLPFVDPEGQPLAYSFTVTAEGGADVTAEFAGLNVSGNVLGGTLPKLPGVFTVTVTADDGGTENATASDSFQLTLQNVNDAPEAANVALEPYFGAVQEVFDGIDVGTLAEFFTDPDGDALTLDVDPDTLPAGLSYDAEERVIVGTPTEGGSFEVRVIATDAGGLSTSLTLALEIDAPEVGDTFTIEAEDFTGLGEAENFYAAATAGASGSQIIKTNANQTGRVSTDLGAADLPPGYYTVAVTVFDETDGAATFAIDVGGTSVTENASFDDAGTWVNGNGTTGRGNAGQAGNLKTLSFETVVYIEAGTILTIEGLADDEHLRIDSVTLTRAEPQDLPPAAPTLDLASVAENADGAVIGILSAADPDGDAVTFSTTDARFVVEGETLRLAEGVSLDHEAVDTVQVEVTATDAEGNATTALLDIAVENVNEAPVLGAEAALADLAVASGETASIDVAAALGASDPDAGDMVAYEAVLAGGQPLPAGLSLAGGILEIGAELAQGSYAVEVFTTDGSLDSDSVQFTLTVGEPAPFSPIVIQAEDGVIALSAAPDGDTTETAVRDADNPEPGSTPLRPDFSGTGYVDYGNDAGDRLDVSFTVPEAGEYVVNIRYASQDIDGGPRVLDLALNGGAPVVTSFASTGPSTDGPEAGFNNWETLSLAVTLQAGANTLSLAIPEGVTAGPNIDRIEITRPDDADTSADADELPLFLSGPDGDLNETQAASINFNLAGIDADIVTTEVSFDGGATRTAVLPDADGDFTVSGSDLAAGSYTVTAIVTDEAGNEARTAMQIVVADPDVSVAPFTIQAEDAGQVAVDDEGAATDTDFTRVVDSANPDAFGNYRAGAVGGAYIDFGANAGDAIVFTVVAPAAGAYEVGFRYANGGADNRPLVLSLNGGAGTSVDFVPGPVVDNGTEETGWESWLVQTVELDLAEGTNQIRLEIPAGGSNGPNIDEANFTYLDGEDDGDGSVPSFSVAVEGESFAITDIEADATSDADTVVRTAANPEPNANDTNSGPDELFDADGLRQGYEGTGYLDMGGEAGDAAAFTVDAPGAGTYELTVRYANGGAGDRPMTLSVNGVEQVLAFAPTSTTGDADPWANWTEVTVEVSLSEGSNEISFTNTTTAGPNIDRVTVSREGDGGPGPRDAVAFEEVVKINFEPPAGQTTSGLPAGYATPEGYLADTGAAYGDRGNGFTYGWVSEASVADGTENGTTPLAQPANANWYKGTVADASDLQKTYAHFEYPGAGASGSRAWEMALEDGTYQVTLSVGDTAGAFDSTYAVNVEGQSFMPDWVPANPIDGSTAGGGFRSTLVTGIVTVTDGRLTIDSIGGENTEIQYLEVEEIPDLTPGDDRSADQDYSFFVAPVAASLDGQVSIEIGADGELPSGIDPTASFVVGVNLQAPGHRGPNVAHVDGVKLVETLTGEEVEIDVQVSGGADSLTIRPIGDLKENTSYTLKVQDVLDLGSVSDADAPLRQMQDLTTSFVTGEAPEDVPREVAFATDTLLDGFGDGAFGYTSVEFGPDGKLYIATITGEIHRWTVGSDGRLVAGSQETLSLDYLDEGAAGRRGIIGMVFDPEDPNTIWISDNAPIPRESKAFNTPEFSGRVSKITLGEGGAFDDVAAETFAYGFPRSGGDHVTNSLEFRRNPDFGAEGGPEYLLYLSQGSNSAGGAPDNAWGNRPERLFNAAILEIDVTKDAPEGGHDIRTEPIDLTDNPETAFSEGEFNEDGTYPGMYNPFAEDAVVKIFATGVRNAYDLVWHSNGNLYVPTNGTASGAKTPEDPTQPFDETISNSPKQYDYFFTVDEGGYYGHPNVLRDEYILNGGNPTSGADPHEVVGGNDGNSSTDGYPVGVEVDPNYDYDGVYNLGYNRSPNGATEYTGNAFGSNLKGAILFAQFSTGDNVRVIRVDETGAIIGDDVLRRPDGSVIDDYIDPLDIIENPVTGQLYLMTLNRGTGASQLILLTPAPGGVTQDVTADEGGNLELVAFDVTDTSAAIFEVRGLDDDITALRVSFDGGPETTVTLDGDNRFTIDLASLEGETVATLAVTDDDLNTATASVSFVPGAEPQVPEFVSLVTIQAEDRTPGDGTSVTVPTGPSAEIEIRDAQNPEDGTTGLVEGLRPGAFGTDGNTDNLDGTAGGYADFGATNADFMTFTFEVPAGNAGQAMLQIRYVNGGTTARPLQVEVNGTIVTVEPFAPTTAATTDESWSNWQVVEIPATLVGGTNTVTLRATESTGPNIDQLEVFVASAETPPPDSGDGTEVVDGVTYVIHEAETATLDGAAVVGEDRTQSGDFVDFTGTADQSISWTVNVAEAGSYAVDILYALASTKEARPMTLAVNGSEAGTLSFAPNSNEGETLWGPQSVTIALVAGANTITVTAPGANGPNVDYLRISQEPIDLVEPVPAEIDGSGRIELEADDGAAMVRNGSSVEFYFTVAEDGVYQIDTAANAGAPNGLGLTWFLDGEEVNDTAFPGTGENAEESIFLELEGGRTYTLRVDSDAPGASAIDYVDISPSVGNANADIEVASGDAAFAENRLHFSYLENPVQDGVTRDFKDTGVVRISNAGSEDLSIQDVDLTGPFQLTSPASLEGLTIAAGGFVDVTVAFDRSAYTPPSGSNAQIDGTSTIFEGRLRLQTNDADDPITDIDLAGFWQRVPEGGQEPNVNEIWEIFGFGNRIENLTLRGGGENSALSTDDVFAKTDETEVLSPYWRIADGVDQVRITQLAAFHGPGGATMGIHNPGNKNSDITFWNHEGTDNQRLLPNAGNDQNFATAVFDGSDIPAGWSGNGVFGLEVAGLSSDPRLNPSGDVIVEGAQQGHTVKIFQALDADGEVIPNVYLGVMDYTGINYDYNDNLFVIEGIAPVGFGQSLAVSGLDDAAADDRLVFTSIDEPANDQQQVRDEAVVTLTNDGFAPLSISGITLGDPESFEIVGQIPTEIAAGGSATITVRFTGTHAGGSAGAEIHKSTLTVTSDDPSAPDTVIQLAGIAQEFSERGSEPTVAQIVEAFGYSTDMAQGDLAGGGAVETVGDEVLMPYLEALDPSRDVEVIQIAAFLQQNNVARLSVHGLQSAEASELFAQDDQQYQTILPDGLVAGGGDSGGVARATIGGDAPFGLFVSVDGRPTYASWTDPEANRIDPDFGQLVGDEQGHLIRFFQALDAEGNAIEGTYIAIQDYPGAGNYDYNDHMFVIKNVKPHELGAEDDADADGVNDALQTDGDDDGVVDFFDPDTDTDPGPDPEPNPGGRGAYVLGVNFGGAAIALDPVLGEALVGQNDSRVTLSGAINPAQGADYASDPNGAGATAGSAFKTYEDGPDWMASIAVENGTYLVTLYTQETYWNASGQRQFDATVNGQQVITDLDPFAEAGPDTPIAFEAVVTVTDGTIDIDMSADIDNATLNAVTIHEYVLPGAEDGQTPFLGGPFLVGEAGVTIDASDYDDGGQGVAYNDAPGLQGGTAGGHAGSDVELTSAGNVGWIQDGEWLEYTVDVAEAGTYDLSFLSSLGSSGGGARAIEASFAKGGVVYESTGSVAVDPTGGWTDFQPTDTVQVTLEAGPQIMRVSFSGGSQDLASVSLTQAPQAMAAAFAPDDLAGAFAEGSGSTSLVALAAAWSDEDTLADLGQSEPDLDPLDPAETSPSHLGSVFGHDLIS